MQDVINLGMKGEVSQPENLINLYSQLIEKMNLIKLTIMNFKRQQVHIDDEEVKSFNPNEMAPRLRIFTTSFLRKIDNQQYAQVLAEELKKFIDYNRIIAPLVVPDVAGH